MTMAPISKSASDDIYALLQSFTQGNTEALNSPALVDDTAKYLIDMYHSGDMGDALIILEQLGEASLSDDLLHRERSLMVLSFVAEKILDEDNEDLLEAIAQMLMRWLKVETEFNGGFEYICLQLSKLLQRMLELNLWYQAENLVGSLCNIKKDNDNKNRLLSRVITRVHGSIANKNLLDKLIDTYVDEKNTKSDVAGALLLHLGVKSTPQMLGTLSQCQNKEQRFRLLNLIPEAGEDAIPSLVEELSNTPSWYYARNIIHLITKIGDPELFTYVEPFMEHKDIRVQHEVIECARKINCDGLLRALNVCDDRLKPNIIRLLGPLKRNQIGNTFRGILENYAIFDDNLQDDIIQEVCSFIHFYPGKKSEEVVEALLDDYQEFKHFSDDTFKAVEYAYLALQNTKGNGQDEEVIPEIEIGPESGIVPLIQIDKEQDYILAEGSSQNWLHETLNNDSTPSSLRAHLARRAEFYNRLSHDEFLAFSAVLNHETLSAGECLVNAGDVHSNLYFIEDGNVALEFPKDGSKISIRDLSAGDIFGHDIFMSGSDWMVTLKAINDVEVFIFDQEQLLNLQPSYPLLCQKILEYSKNNDIILRLYKATTDKSLSFSKEEPIPLNGDIGEQIADIQILDQFSQGICFCFELPKGMESADFAEREFTLFFDREPSKPIQVTAHSIGFKFNADSDQRLCVLARFREEANLSGYTCTLISL